MSAFPPLRALGIPPGEGILSDKSLDDWGDSLRQARSRRWRCRQGNDGGWNQQDTRSTNFKSSSTSQSKMATISNSNQHAFCWENCALLCSVRPAPTIFILMADLGFLRTTEYTGYSCPSNKTLLLSPALEEKRYCAWYTDEPEIIASHLKPWEGLATLR